MEGDLDQNDFKIPAAPKPVYGSFFWSQLTGLSKTVYGGYAKVLTVFIMASKKNSYLMFLGIILPSFKSSRVKLGGGGARL